MRPQRHAIDPRPLPAALLLALTLAACGDRGAGPAATSPAAPSPPASSAAPATSAWLGRWTGPEGTFLALAGGPGDYDITIQNLDGPRSFKGRADGDVIRFERDGVQETLHASNGDATGMKWLAGKSHCLTVRAGEGYCRDAL